MWSAAPRLDGCGDARRSGDEGVGDGSRREGVDALSHEVDKLLVDGPGPGEGSDAGEVFEEFVVEEAGVEVEEGAEGSAEAALGHDAAEGSEEDALRPVHDVVHDEALAVGLVGLAKEALEGVGGDVRVGAAGEVLLEFFGEGHGGDTSDAGQEAFEDCLRGQWVSPMFAALHGRWRLWMGRCLLWRGRSSGGARLLV